jgi:hypothetical protein
MRLRYPRRACAVVVFQMKSARLKHLLVRRGDVIVLAGDLAA